MKARYRFSIFTPAYNAEATLERVFESLMAQTFRDFEWLIVDDGSSDGTSDLVATFRSRGDVDFPIRYFWQENQHKKVAHNRAVKESEGEFLLPTDSDDRFPAQALQRFVDYWESIPEEKRERFAGVTGLCRYEDGSIVGDRFPTDTWLDSTPQELQYRYRVQGEKWGFTRTDILRRYPFPEAIRGYVPEGVVWSAVGREYLTRFVNEPVRIYYQESQGTKKGDLRRAKDPGRLYQKYLVLSDEIRWFRWAPVWFLMEAARMNRFYCHCGPDTFSRYWPSSRGGKILALLTFPLGALWYVSDEVRIRVPRRSDRHSRL